MKNKNEILLGDCLKVMPEFEEGSIDCIVTDPPYGFQFMSKDWDKAIPSVEIWKECLRVLKPGAFAFVMSIPRQDCLAHMIVNLSNAGFNVAFSGIYWTFASGFPKAQNLSKAADKRAGAKQDEIGVYQAPDGRKRDYKNHNPDNSVAFKNKVLKYSKAGRPITTPSTDQAKTLDGAYGGFQPKPAVEIIIVAMKPIEEKTYLDQAISKGHGCTWLDDCRIPTREKDQKQGRFPANVICEDDVLDDGRVIKGTPDLRQNKARMPNMLYGDYGSITTVGYGDKGSYSRYFSLDAWFAERIKQLPKEVQKTFPWLIVPKASFREKNSGLNGIEEKEVQPAGLLEAKRSNSHPTIKTIKLMSWLITLASREGDIVLDPFLGSGTTYIAATALGRFCKGIEREKEYYELAMAHANLAQKNISAYF